LRLAIRPQCFVKCAGVFHAAASLLCLGLLSLGLSGCTSQSDKEGRTPEETVDEFYGALQGGNAALALSLLARDASIFEMGWTDQSRKDYGGAHLQADIEAAGGLRRELLSRRRGGEGDERWVISTYRETGTYRGGDIDTKGTETVLLRRTGGAWQILHLHFSNDLYLPKTINLPKTKEQQP